MLRQLRSREREGRPIRVALVGAGSMGVGIAWQVARTPGMRLVSVTDRRPGAVAEASAAARARPVPLDGGDAPPVGAVWDAPDPLEVLDRRRADVLVEATSSIGFAGRVCLAAIRAGVDVVLMNAEVDLALGPLLSAEAERTGVVVTSDGGDQHGVLARMIDEIRLWGFDVVMAGNIKGFLDRRATPDSIAAEAAVRHLDPVQCCAYTDGTKLNVEMALVANGFGLVPWTRGMAGPRARHVDEVLELFDFAGYGATGVVDYVLGAEPGGGVYVVGRCDDPLQRRYLEYYKRGEGPFYLFYRPYHLCHLETTRAVAEVSLRRSALLAPWRARTADVYAIAKRDLGAGEPISHPIGGDQLLGLVDRCPVGEAEGLVPITLLEAEPGRAPRLVHHVAAGRVLTWDDVELADTEVCELGRRQREIVTQMQPGRDARASGTRSPAFDGS